jgi:HK97 family phage portal protein
LGLLSRIFRPSAVKAAAEGQWHPPPYQVADGWLPTAAGTLWNFWQCGYDVQPYGSSAIVEACISAYSQTVAMCSGTHWRLLPNGGRERVTTSALSRILRKPNEYATISDFMLNLTHALYQDGNAYALALRNDRFEIESLHLMDSRLSWPRIATNGELFYALGGNEIIERTFSNIGAESALSAVPARDVLHVKLKTRGGRGGRAGPGDQLVGVSPMLAAALDEAASNAMAAQAVRFYLNSSRPSGVLTSDQVLTVQQMADLRTAWDAKSKGMNVGDVPILSHGLKWQPTAASSKDSQLAEIMGYTDKRIAAVYRVPLPMLNLGNEGPQGSTESLMQFWVSTGLGFALNHIEEALGKTFGLAGLPGDYLEFDTAALLRSLFKDRVDAYARGVQGGIFAPDEARADFELPKAPDGAGAEPRVQQQVVPLSFGMDMEPTAPGAQLAPPAPGDDEGDKPDGKQFADLIRAAVDRYDTIHS